MKKNENGFSAVEILIVFVVIILLGAIGWLVYDRQKSKSVNSKTAQTSQQEQQEAPKQGELDVKDEQAFFEIKELGVKFELSKAPKGLYYHIGNNGRTAYFSLEELKNTDCAADKTAQVALTRYTKDDFESDGLVSEDNALKQGEYYYSGIGGQAACSDDAAIQEKASKLRAEMLQLLPEALVQIQ